MIISLNFILSGIRLVILDFIYYYISAMSLPSGYKSRYKIISLLILSLYLCGFLVLSGLIYYLISKGLVSTKILTYLTIPLSIYFLFILFNLVLKLYHMLMPLIYKGYHISEGMECTISNQTKFFYYFFNILFIIINMFILYRLHTIMMNISKDVCQYLILISFYTSIPISLIYLDIQSGLKHHLTITVKPISHSLLSKLFQISLLVFVVVCFINVFFHQLSNLMDYINLGYFQKHPENYKLFKLYFFQEPDESGNRSKQINNNDQTSQNNDTSKNIIQQSNTNKQLDNKLNFASQSNENIQTTPSPSPTPAPSTSSTDNVVIQRNFNELPSRQLSLSSSPPHTVQTALGEEDYTVQNMGAEYVTDGTVKKVNVPSMTLLRPEDEISEVIYVPKKDVVELTVYKDTGNPTYYPIFKPNPEGTECSTVHFFDSGTECSNTASKLDKGKGKATEVMECIKKIIS